MIDRLPPRLERGQFRRRHPWRARLRGVAPWFLPLAVFAAAWIAAALEG